jgi:hypothetical protein
LDDLTKLLGTWNIGLRVVKCEGESMTYHKLSGKILKGSDLDHFVVNEAAFVVATPASVDRGCSASDHWPISFRLRVKTVPHALDAVSDVQMGKVDPYKVRECGSTIAVQGCFVELAKKLSECEAAVESADLDDEGRKKAMESLINASTADLQSAFSDVVESLDLRVDSRKPGMGKHQVSRRFSRLVQAKTAAGLRFWATGGEDEREQFRELTWKVRKYMKEQRDRRELKSIIDATSRYVKGTVPDKGSRMPLKKKLFWDWLRKTVSGSGTNGGGGFCPVIGDDGNLEVTEEGKVKAWTSWFQRLATDNSGVERSLEGWEARLGPGATLSELPGINTVLEYPELRRVLSSMNNWKGAGQSTLILELFKYSILEEDEDEPSVLTTVLLKVLNLMLQYGFIAEALRKSMVITLPKKGDLSDRSNHRGISLIEALSKILHTIIARRLDSGLEAANRYSRTQAGFRREEEALGQVVTLFDLCMRRLAAGLKTYILFGDMVKAYDRVPQWAFLLKAKRIGVQGAMHKLLEHILTTAKIMVGRKGKSFSLNQGLGQGWPDSTVDYNIFVNDIMEGQMGVELPHSGGVKIPGLLYADDSFILADSLDNMETGVSNFDAWASLNCQEFGISKCGLMVVSAVQDQELDMQELKARNLSLGQKLIPVVDSYLYLGVTLRCNLSLEGIVAYRVQKARGSVSTVAPVIANVRIPLAMRRLTLLAFILPGLIHGGELIGMRKGGLAKPLQDIMNNALRLIVTGRQQFQAQPSMTVVMLELGLPPVQACWNGSRARALAKYKNSRTFVAALYDGDQQAAQGWVGESKAWLTANAPSLEAFNVIGKQYLKKKGVAEFLDYDEVPAKMLARKVKWSSAEKFWASCRDVAYIRYIACKYRETRGYIKDTGTAGQLSKGYHRIFQMRCGSFVTGRRIARQYQVEDLLSRCLCCEENLEGGESLGHFLLECPMWEEERAALEPVLVLVRKVAAENNITWPRELIVSLLLGGVAVIDEEREATLGELWSLGPILPSGDRDTPLCRHIAAFLTSVDDRRMNLVFRAMAAASTGVEEESVEECDLLVGTPAANVATTAAGGGEESEEECCLLSERPSTEEGYDSDALLY